MGERQTPHWDGCESEHHGCALARLEEARAERDTCLQAWGAIRFSLDGVTPPATGNENVDDAAQQIVALREALVFCADVLEARAPDLERFADMLEPGPAVGRHRRNADEARLAAYEARAALREERGDG